MALLFDIMHLVAATLFALVGLGFEREEECAPIQYQSVAYMADAELTVDYARAEAGVTYSPVRTDCEAKPTTIVYPVL